MFTSCSGKYCNEPEFKQTDPTDNKEDQQNESTTTNEENEQSVPVNREDIVYNTSGSGTSYGIEHLHQLVDEFKSKGYFQLNPDSVGGPIYERWDKGKNNYGSSKLQVIRYITPGKKGPIMSNKDWMEDSKRRREIMTNPSYIGTIPASIFPNKLYTERTDSLYPIYYTADPDSMNVFITSLATPDETNPTELDKYNIGRPLYIRPAR